MKHFRPSRLQDTFIEVYRDTVILARTGRHHDVCVGFNGEPAVWSMTAARVRQLGGVVQHVNHIHGDQWEFARVRVRFDGLRLELAVDEVVMAPRAAEPAPPPPDPAPPPPDPALDAVPTIVAVLRDDPPSAAAVLRVIAPPAERAMGQGASAEETTSAVLALATWLLERPAAATAVVDGLADMPACEQCGCVDVNQIPAMTAYPWDGEGPDPNRPLDLCPACALDYVEYWTERWEDYYADIRGGLHGY